MHKVGVNTESEAPAVITVLGLYEFFFSCVLNAVHFRYWINMERNE